MNRLLKVLLALAALVVLSLSLVSPAATIRLDEQPDEKSSATAWIGIENFGKVNDHFYRGSLPKQSDYTGLVALGVKTVISLRHRPDERVMQSAERAGMRYINLPMNVRGYPPEDLAPRFLALVNNPENWPVYVYCHGARHRTGVMTAIYRMAVEGWDIHRACAEMRRYGFYKRWGHGPLKAYVLDYYCRLLEGRLNQIIGGIVASSGLATTNDAPMSAPSSEETARRLAGVGLELCRTA